MDASAKSCRVPRLSKNGSASASNPKRSIMASTRASASASARPCARKPNSSSSRTVAQQICRSGFGTGSPPSPQLAGAQLRSGHAVDEHFARRRLQQPVDQAHRGGLARAVRADERHEVAVGDAEARSRRTSELAVIRRAHVLELDHATTPSPLKTRLHTATASSTLARRRRVHQAAGAQAIHQAGGTRAVHADLQQLVGMLEHLGRRAPEADFCRRRRSAACPAKSDSSAIFCSTTMTVVPFSRA